MFNSLWIASVSSSGSITLSAGVYSSLVLIMKMRYCACKPLQRFSAFGLVQRHAFQMQTQLHDSSAPRDDEYFRGFVLCWFHQVVNKTLKGREREKKKHFYSRFFFSSMVFRNCFLCSSRTIFILT